MKFYKKELVSNRLALPNGKSIRFEQVGDSDSGVIATEDPGLIDEMDKAAAEGRGGVVAIDEAAYTELKKNPPVGRSSIRSLNSQTIRELLSPRKPAVAEAVVVKEPSAPMEIPKGLVTVSSRRKLKELTSQAVAE